MRGGTSRWFVRGNGTGGTNNVQWVDGATLFFGASEKRSRVDGYDDVIYVNHSTPRDFVGVARRHQLFRERRHGCERRHIIILVSNSILSSWEE